MVDEFDTKVPLIRKSWVNQHLNRQIPPRAHTAMYNWKVLYFGALTEEFSKHKGATDINKVIDVKVLSKINKDKNKDQLDLFSN